jgi:hypothetical protein
MRLIQKHGLAQSEKMRDVKGVILTTTKLESPVGSFAEKNTPLMNQLFSFSTFFDEIKEGPIPSPNKWWHEEQ